MNFKKPNLKNFKSFAKESIYIVYDGKVTDAYLSKNEAMDMVTDHNKVKRVSLTELKELMDETKYNAFVKKYESILK